VRRHQAWDRPPGVRLLRCVGKRTRLHPLLTEIRTAEVIGSRCLRRIWQSGCDRAPPAEHPARVAASVGWVSRLSSRLGRTTTACCPIAGCTTDADIAARALFPDGALLDRALQPGYVRLSGTDDRGIRRVLSDPDRFAFSGSIRWHGMHVKGQLVVPAGGQLKLPQQRRKLGLRGLVGGPELMAHVRPEFDC
jgi:hypothetical protein